VREYAQFKYSSLKAKIEMMQGRFKDINELIILKNQYLKLCFEKIGQK